MKEDYLDDVTIECLDVVKLGARISFVAFQHKVFRAREVHTLTSNVDQTCQCDVAQTCLYHFIVVK